MKTWLSTGVVLMCFLLTAAMLGFIGLQPTEQSVKRAEWLLKDNQKRNEVLFEETQFALRVVSTLNIKLEKLEKRVEELEKAAEESKQDQ